MEVPFEQLGLHVGPASDLLRFYQAKLKLADGEREGVLQRLADCDTQSGEIHGLRRTINSRTDEVNDLQLALEDAKLFLFDEREQVLKLQAENDNLKVQEIEDRKRIQELLALTQPLAQEFTFYRDTRPEPVASPPAPSSLSLEGRGGFPIRPPLASASPSSTNSLAGAGGPATGRAKQVGADPTRRGQGAGRVIMLEGVEGEGATSASTAALALQVQSLTRALADFRALAEEQKGAFARDRAAAREREGRRAAADGAALRTLEAGLAAAQAKLSGLTRDFLMQRLALGTEAREAKEEAAVAKASVAEATAELARVSAQADADVGALRRAMEGSAGQLRAVLGSRLEAASDGVKVVAAQASADKAAFEAREGKHLVELRRAKSAYTALSRRRAGEVEGFTRDVTALRRSLRALETSWASSAAFPTEAIAGLEMRLDGAEDALAQAAGNRRAAAAAAAAPAPRTVSASVASILTEMAADATRGPAAAEEDSEGEGEEEEEGGAPPSRKGIASLSSGIASLMSGMARSAGMQSAGRGSVVGGRGPSPVVLTAPGPSRSSSGRSGEGLGRTTLAGYNAVAYAERVMTETLESRPAGEEPLPGDLDYDGGEEGEGEGGAGDEGWAAAANAWASAGTPSAGSGARSPPSGGSGGAGSAGSAGSRGSRVSLGGPRRVLLSSPSAAPRFDASAGGSADPSVVGRSSAMRGDLEELRETIAALDRRAASLSRGTSM